jgi:hypothetical protein
VKGGKGFSQNLLDVFLPALAQIWLKPGGTLFIEFG